MKNLLIIFSILFVTTAFSKTRFAHPNQIIIGHDGDTSSLIKSIFKNGLDEMIEVKQIGNTHFHLLEANPTLKLSEYITDFKMQSTVDWVAPNYVYLGDYMEFSPNDPVYKKQYHHSIIRSEEAWDISTGEKEIVVAVTDDGFKLDHEDLSNIWYTNPNEIIGNGIDDDGNGYIDDTVGWDFNEGDNSPMSDSRNGSHGTHVAGIVGAGFNNGIGVTGFGPKIKVMPLKFYGTKAWTSAMVLETYTYAANNGANIITTSYYIDNFVGDTAYEKALSYAYSKGLILFNSAGNGNKKQSPRTKFTKMILVASTKSKNSRRAKKDHKSSFSNYGRGVDIAAPGDPIHSTGRSLSYVDMSGTSMAAPNAAGLAALIWSVHPSYTRDQVVAKLMTSTDNIDVLNTRYKNLLGSGRINAKVAVEDKVAPVTIRDSWYDSKTKTYNLHLRGTLDPQTFNRRGGIILRRNSSEEEILAEFENEYFIATNVLKIKVENTGSYELIVKSSAFLDPFGQELDGDLNGNAGGDYQSQFVVR
ncbi:MAG: S8 family serine peptidase [Bacteriovoracaceae bacterium]|nr:S8 family serine peptidase [Bacteriovoracaceae bacterium]